jgi:hypothetical protein
MGEGVSNNFFAVPDLAKCAKREVRIGFVTGISTPGRRSTPVCSIVPLQRAVYRSELGVELRANALNRGDDRKRDRSGNTRSRSRRIHRAGMLQRSSSSNLALEPLSSGECKTLHSRHPPGAVDAGQSGSQTIASRRITRPSRQSPRRGPTLPPPLNVDRFCRNPASSR